MKHILLSFLFIFSLSSLAGTRIVSDLDDTIKVTHSDGWRAIYFSLFTKRAFAGQPELYKYMRDRAESLMVLSASPRILMKRVQNTLNKFEIPFDSIVLRNTAKEKDKIKYKVAAIEKELLSNQDDYILIGDDIGKDPEAYQVIKDKYPNRVLDIYIRPMKNRTLPSAQIPYISSYDIARNEYLKGRMGLMELKDIAYLIDREPKNYKIIPSRFYCPKSGVVYDGQLADKESHEKVKNRISKICAKRK